MGKITPRVFLAVFFWSIITLLPTFAMALNYEGPSPIPGSTGTAKGYFVGFVLYNAPTISLKENNPASCENASDGSLLIEISGGTTPYTISWSGGSSGNSETLNNLAPGQYSVTVTDGEGEQASDAYTVTFQDDVKPVVATRNLTVQLNNNGTASIQASELDNGSSDNCGIDSMSVSPNSFNCNDVGANSVTLSVTDINGNTASATATVTVEDNVAPEVITQNITLQLDANGQASITAEDIDNGSNDACGIQSFALDTTEFNCSNIGQNIVNLTVIDNNGNSASSTATVTVEDNVAPEVITQNITVQLDANGQASITTEDIDNGSNDACGIQNLTLDTTEFDCSNIGQNIVNLTVTDNNGNSASSTATVTVEDNVAPEVITQNITLQLDANGQASITAEDIDNGSNDACGIQSFALDTTEYNCSNIGQNIVNLTVIDNNGNSASSTATVTVEDNVAPEVITQNITVQLDANGQASITAEDIDNGSNDACGIQNLELDITSFDCNNLGDNTVSLTATDLNDNTAVGTAIVTVEDNIKPVLPTVNNITWGCEYTVEAPVAQDNCDGPIVGIPNRSEIFTESGTIIWTFTDASGNSDTLEQTITINPIIAEIETTEIDCFGFENGTAQVTASGGVGNLMYSWEGLSGTGNSQENLAPGDYLVSISDQNGCSVNLNFTITQPDDLQMTEPSSTPVSCFGGNDGSISAGNVTGGTAPYEYSIDNETWNTIGEFSSVEAATHTIFVRDANNCALQVTVNVEEPDVLNATLNKTDVNCFEGSDGSISLTNLSGGSGGYEFSVDAVNWTSGTQPIEGLTAGSYEVLIRDSAVPDCIIVLNAAYQINQPEAALEVEIQLERTEIYGTQSGSATANPTGGTPGYSYQWRKKGSNEIIQQTKTASELSAGVYELIVTDSNGCSTEPIEFEIIEAMQAFIASRTLCEDVGDDTAIRTSFFEVEDLTAVGGVAPYSYSWEFGDNIPMATGVGEHRVEFPTTGNKTVYLTITDNTGEQYVTSQELYVGKCYEPCGKSENFVFDPSSIYIGDINGVPIDTESTNCSETQDKYIYIVVDKSANAYNPYIELVYVISNSISDKLVTYTSEGCRSGDEIDDDPNDNKENLIGEFIRLTRDPIDIDCGDNLAVDNFYITWTNVDKKKCGQNNNAFCYSSDEPVTLPTPLSARATPTPILCKGGETGVIDVQASGGFPPYSFNITGPNNEYESSSRIAGLTAGTYTVYVRDSRGNTTSVTTEIVEPDSRVEGVIEIFPPSCYSYSGSAKIEAFGGTPFEDGSYEYLWNDPNNQTTQEATGLTAGNYTVTVIDANGCQFITEVEITQPEQLSVADAGPDQDFNCGFNTTILSANTPETGVGKWTIIDGPAGGVIADDTNPNSEFTGNPGTYTLAWTISHEDETCPTSDEVQITFVEDCSTLDFDGIDDHVFLGDNYGFTSGNFSIEAWIRPKSVNGTRTIFSKRNSKNLGSGFDLIINSGAPTFRIGNKSVTTSHKVTTNRWHHIAAIFNNSEVRLYVDGIRVGTSSVTNPTAISAPAIIGAMHNADTPDLPVNYFHGWIEEVRLWGRALTEEQLRFMMNQRLEISQNPVRGDVLPIDIPGSLQWSNLKGYFQMKVTESGGGSTPNLGETGIAGELRNIETSQENTAPLPYVSASTGTWHSKNSWDPSPTKYWTFPNDKGINGTDINWNIAKQNHNLNSNNKDIKLLGLFNESENTLDMLGTNNSSGNELRITHYLKLDGFIDLNGESQLVQTLGSILDEASSGYIERDQQGTQNSFNYNYWSSPVSKQGSANNSGYTVSSVLRDGTNTNSPQNLSFAYAHTHADASYSGNKRISTYWLHKFHGDANSYGHWRWIGHTGELKAGEGFTMKGTSGQAAISDLQNYIFQGKPNNGTIVLNISNNENRLVGNPYPSALDADEFLRDNLKDINGGRNSQNVFNGALYFWDHFGQENSHVLRDYVGGYATYNLSGGAPAASTDFRINNTTDKKGNKVPRRYVPVGQGFFVNTVVDAAVSGNYSISGGNVLFKNNQRVFVKESASDSRFLRPEEHSKEKQAEYKQDTRYKLRLKFKSPAGYHRQLLATADANTTNGFDLGYDAPMIDNNLEDMFWLINNAKFVIQGVPNFNPDQVLPIGVKTAKPGRMEISIDSLENFPDNLPVFLKNKQDSTYHDLRKEAYSTQVNSEGENHDQYEIVFSKPQTDGNEGDFNEINLSIRYYHQDQMLQLINPDLLDIQQLKIYSINGQEVATFGNQPIQKEIRLHLQRPLSNAVYIVKVMTADGENYSRKFLFKKAN